MLEQVYAGLLALRRSFYRFGLRKPRHPGVPVVIVGNLTVGGTGKTPMVIALAEALTRRGWRVGVVSRGYGRQGRGLCWVEADSDPLRVGDEPLEIRLATGCPVVVAADRARAAAALAASGAVDLILSDDGLQHWRLARDVAIVLVDGARGFGNGRLLPAGPLREPSGRIEQADFVLVRDGTGADAFSIEPIGFRRPGGGALAPIDSFAGREVVAAAGIAHPDRFFTLLASLGIRLRRRISLPDHGRLPPALLAERELPLLLTRKDAVKLRLATLSPAQEIWYLETRVGLPEGFLDRLLARIAQTS